MLPNNKYTIKEVFEHLSKSIPPNPHYSVIREFYTFNTWVSRFCGWKLLLVLNKKNHHILNTWQIVWAIFSNHVNILKILNLDSVAVDYTAGVASEVSGDILTLWNQYCKEQKTDSVMLLNWVAWQPPVQACVDSMSLPLGNQQRWLMTASLFVYLFFLELW